MPWIKTPNNFFNLDHISRIHIDTKNLYLKVYSRDQNSSYPIEGDEAIALISAIEEMGCKDVSYSDPSSNLEDSKLQEWTEAAYEFVEETGLEL